MTWFETVFDAWRSGRDEPLLKRFTCGWINVDGQMTIKQSASFGSHSRKGLAAKDPPVVGDGSPSRWRSPTKQDKSNDGNQGSPSCWRSHKKAATVTTAPPVVGGVGQRRQGLSQKLEMDPLVIGRVICRDEQKQKMAPVVGDGSNRCRQSQMKAVASTTAPPVVGVDEQWRRRITWSLAEKDNSGNGNDPSPSHWQRRTTAATGHPVVGGDGWWQPQMRIGTHRNGNGNNGSPSCRQSWTTAAMAPQSLATASPVVGGVVRRDRQKQ
jgi:hypothetical protein